MGQDQISKLQAQALERKLLYFQQPEVQKLQATTKRLVQELKAQVDENCDEKE
jgi:predicted nuclease with TOPRIM domain